MEKIDKEKAAARLKEMLTQWENNPERMQNGYEYEKTFIEMMKQFEREIFQQSVGKTGSKNYKKKS